jgi:hypothetical protein
LTRESGAARGEEKEFARAVLEKGRAAASEVILEGGESGAADGDEALFGAFAHDANEAGLGLKVGEFERADLGDAEAGSVEEFEHGAVAKTEGRVRGRGFGEAGDFVAIEELGKLGFGLGKGEEGGGVVGDFALSEEKAVEIAERDEVTGDGAGGQTGGEEVVQIKAKIVAGGGPGGEMSGFPGLPGGKIALVGVQGGARKPLLHAAKFKKRKNLPGKSHWGRTWYWYPQVVLSQ